MYRNLDSGTSVGKQHPLNNQIRSRDWIMEMIKIKRTDVQQPLETMRIMQYSIYALKHLLKSMFVNRTSVINT